MPIRDYADRLLTFDQFRLAPLSGSFVFSYCASIGPVAGIIASNLEAGQPDLCHCHGAVELTVRSIVA
jgi:hypothetical protein